MRSMRGGVWGFTHVILCIPRGTVPRWAAAVLTRPWTEHERKTRLTLKAKLAR